MKIYETDRLILRRLQKSDSEILLNFLKRNRNFLSEWEPLRDDSYYDIETVNNAVEKEDKVFRNKSGFHLYIFNKGEEKINGSAALTNIVYGVFQSCYLGYKLDEAEINRGKMSEALKKMIEIAFNEYGIHRLDVKEKFIVDFLLIVETKRM